MVERLPAYDPGGGIQAYGATASFLTQLGPRWGINFVGGDVPGSSGANATQPAQALYRQRSSIAEFPNAQSRAPARCCP